MEGRSRKTGKVTDASMICITLQEKYQQNSNYRKATRKSKALKRTRHRAVPSAHGKHYKYPAHALTIQRTRILKRVRQGSRRMLEEGRYTSARGTDPGSEKRVISPTGIHEPVSGSTAEYGCFGDIRKARGKNRSGY